MSGFTPEAYAAIREGAERSARAALPVMLRLMQNSKHAAGWPWGVLDVGAGEGLWSRARAELAPDALGVALDENPGDGVRAWHADRREPLPLYHEPDGQRWPLVLCLELAEHLDAETGDWLVSELCRVGARIAWSAAVPGQRGLNHVNEQWPWYWARRFAAHGFVLRDPWREALWADEEVEPWYRQNLLLARPARGGDEPDPFRAPRSLVHPDIFSWRVADADAWRQKALDAEADARRARDRYDLLDS